MAEDTSHELVSYNQAPGKRARENRPPVYGNRDADSDTLTVQDFLP